MVYEFLNCVRRNYEGQTQVSQIVFIMFYYKMCPEFKVDIFNPILNQFFFVYVITRPKRWLFLAVVSINHHPSPRAYNWLM